MQGEGGVTQVMGALWRHGTAPNQVRQRHVLSVHAVGQELAVLTMLADPFSSPLDAFFSLNFLSIL